MFVPGKPFHPSLMFVGKASSLPESGVPESATLDLAGEACEGQTL